MASDFELTDFVSNVPPALAIPLVRLAPLIAAARSAFQIASWSSSSSYYPSWLALAAWWALCLLIQTTVRRFLPLLLLLVVLYSQRLRRKKHEHLKPTTEHTLRSVISDLNLIHSLLPSSFPTPSISPPVLLRVVVISYIPYILLSFFVSLRVIFALAGTVLLTWRAPWALVLRAILWRSAWLRWSIYKSWAFLSGQPLPEPTFSVQATPNTTTPVQSLRFLFTIYENQRWWMGLDWTAALLPGERPSWCSSSQQPLSPPNAFTLPSNTTVYLPDPKQNGHRLKRTATWKWEEPEWRVVVHKNGGGLSRVERPLPTIKDESPNSSRLLKAAGRLRDSGSSASVNSSAASDSSKSANTTTTTTTTLDNSDAISQEQSLDGSEEDPLTDVDGWVYGDNKWEAQSNRGGMGKYTRYRRWTRVAIVFEEVESVPDGALGVHNEQPENALPVTTQDTASLVPPEIVVGNPPDSPLKQRLRMALNKTSE